MSDLPLRIIVTDPPVGVTWAVQLGKDQRLPPSSGAPDRLSFDLTVRIGLNDAGAGPRLLGPAVQGPPTARFIYVNSGRRAGQAGSTWDRRAKISLKGITPGMVASVLRRSGSLVVEFNGTGKDGEPACATVPLLGKGWRVDQPRGEK